MASMSMSVPSSSPRAGPGSTSLDIDEEHCPQRPDYRGQRLTYDGVNPECPPRSRPRRPEQQHPLEPRRRGEVQTELVACDGGAEAVPLPNGGEVREGGREPEPLIPCVDLGSIDPARVDVL